MAAAQAPWGDIAWLLVAGVGAWHLGRWSVQQLRALGGDIAESMRRYARRRDALARATRPSAPRPIR